MPLVVYIFTLSAFALGLAEFVPVGLSNVIASGLGISVAQSGSIVTAYALGASFSAPLLSALNAGWPGKRTLLTAMLIFTVGSLVAAVTSSFSVMVIARFVAGAGHGLFLAVAAGTAARLAGPEKAGRAVAAVFGGFTLAMAVGVPLSTWFGGMIAWRPVMAAIAVAGMSGIIGLSVGIRDPLKPGSTEHSWVRTLSSLFHISLLSAALVTVLAYAGSFTVYTYLAPLLLQQTGVSVNTVTVVMLVTGVAAGAGNFAGGKLTDHLGINRANTAIIGGIVVICCGMWLFSGSAVMMILLSGLLGVFTFGSVPALQARLIRVAAEKAPHASGVASGLNIAGFNLGIALGSLSGGMMISLAGIASIGLAGTAMSLAGLLLLRAQVRRTRSTVNGNNALY